MGLSAHYILTTILSLFLLSDLSLNYGHFFSSNSCQIILDWVPEIVSFMLLNVGFYRF